MQLDRRPVVHYPAAIESESDGRLYGYYHRETNEYNILSPTAHSHYDFLGTIGDSSDAPDCSANEQAAIPPIRGKRVDAALHFWQAGTKCIAKPYDLKEHVFSRNTGILETDVMLQKSVIISGCGSVGSLVALELARAGVGRFLLVDNDTIDYHNICRHQCSIEDVGKYKVSAVKERIAQINPNAIVRTQPKVIERVTESVFDDFCDEHTAIIGCADNREGDLYADKLSKHYRAPFVSIGFWERAFAGEVFYSIPGETVGYESIFNGSISARVSTNRRIYTFEEDVQNVHFEPGISVDISFVTLVAIKLIIDLLNRDNDGFVPRVLNDLTQFTLVCNTNDPRIGGENAEIFAYPLQITRSIQVS